MSLSGRIKLPAHLNSLDRFLRFIRDCAVKSGFGQKHIKEIILASEESLINIINYSYPEKNGDIEIYCMFDDYKRLTIEIIDTGIPFDMRSLADPDITADMNERKIGGMGVYFIKKIVDDIHYSREKTRNILTLFFSQKHGMRGV